MKFNREDRCRLNLEFFIARRTARTSPENRPGVMSRIAVVSVAVSVAVMLVALAVILGFKREVTARMVGFSAPVEVIDGAGIYAAESRPVAATARFEALLRAVDGAQQRFEPSSRRDGPRLRGVDPGAVDHLDRRRKAHHAGRHLAFETEDHGQRHEHHGHRYGHRNHGDARHHPGPVLRRGAGGAARYEKFEVQTTAIFTVKFHAK